jgi:ubiquinone/menaquinone biosynthesis C-methylase UbiE
MTTAQPGNPHSHEHVKHRARHQFDRWAASYDRSWLSELVFFPTVRACQEEIVRWQRQRNGGTYRLLDVGCGTGNLLATLAADPYAAALVGLDYSTEMVSRAQAKLTALGTSAAPEVVQGDAEHLPFDAASFDVLTCCHSFHHYPHQAAVVREFCRVLRPAGALILIDGFRDNVIGWVLFDVFVARIERHVHHAAWSEIRRLVEDAGFASLRQRKLNVLAPLLVNVAAR